MTDKKMSGKQANCCQDSSIAPTKEELTTETSSCCSSRKEIPIVPVAKNTSCCNGETKTENEETTDEAASCCSSKKRFQLSLLLRKSLAVVVTTILLKLKPVVHLN